MDESVVKLSLILINENASPRLHKALDSVGVTCNNVNSLTYSDPRGHASYAGTPPRKGCSRSPGGGDEAEAIARGAQEIPGRPKRAARPADGSPRDCHQVT
eukprot:scaffold321741_cov26-Prasinocladus_malaysianus.AAC.2